MYIMSKPKTWTIATARRHFLALIGMAAREPQRVYRRNKLVAAVVDPRLADEVAKAEKPTLGDAFSDLQKICEEEDYELAVPPRQNRANPAAPSRTRRR